MKKTLVKSILQRFSPSPNEDTVPSSNSCRRASAERADRSYTSNTRNVKMLKRPNDQEESVCHRIKVAGSDFSRSEGYWEASSFRKSKIGQQCC